MKIIPLKTKMITLADGVPPQELNHVEMLLAVMQAPAGQGLTMAEIVERMPVIDALKAAQASKATSVLLEDAQWSVLNRLLTGFQHWRLVDQFVIDLGDAVKDAKVYTPPVPVEQVAEPVAEAAD